MKKILMSVGLIAGFIVGAVAISKLRAEDLQNFSVTLGQNKAVVLPRWIIQAQVTQSDPPFTVLHDFTGVNSIEFPQVISTLTPAQRQVMIEMLSLWLVRVKAGLEDIPEPETTPTE
jgi:hypothetical protein